jgi:serine/threonine protein kinase, bacterial
MPHPLLEVTAIAGTPAPYLEAVGKVFAIFGEQTQDSGNVSFGVRIGTKRYFVKTTDPQAEAFLDHPQRIELLHNAAAIRNSCEHPTLPELHNIVTSDHGPMLVYDWVDGELLGYQREQPDSALQRFRRLPVDTSLAALDSIYDLHRILAEVGWIAVDLYDGSIIYDFDRHHAHLVDLDSYHQGPFTNTMGRMFGSSRFMAPEEFELGAKIDERTTVFTLGRVAAVLVSDNSLERLPFRGTDSLYEVVTKACQPDPADRHQSVQSFCAAWKSAR